MIRRMLYPIIIGGLFLPAAALAQVAMHVGAEYFRWQEQTTPKIEETGPMFSIGFDYTQAADSGFLFGYRGRLWTGEMDYEGAELFSRAPLKGTTGYFGVTNELQGRWRRQIEEGYHFDVVLGVGWDRWRRALSRFQKEEYDVAYVRLGMDFDTPEVDRWMIGVGAKYPLWTRLDAHLTAIGFDRNPMLKPKRDISAYAHAGYRFDRQWRLIAYADGYRFGESDPEPVTHVTEGALLVFQPESSLLTVGARVEYSFR